MDLYNRKFLCIDFSQFLTKFHRIIAQQHLFNHFKSICEAITQSLNPSFSEDILLILVNFLKILFLNYAKFSSLFQINFLVDSLASIFPLSINLSCCILSLFVFICSLDYSLFYQLDFSFLESMQITEKSFPYLLQLISGNSNGFDGKVLSNSDPILQLIFRSTYASTFIDKLHSFLPCTLR